jgi:hypothetical protein
VLILCEDMQHIERELCQGMLDTQVRRLKSVAIIATKLGKGVKERYKEADILA